MNAPEEKIYKFADALYLRRYPKEDSPKFQYSEILEFRNLLSDYSSEVNKNNLDNPMDSDVYMKCLVDASYDARPAIHDSTQNILAPLAGAVVMPFILKFFTKANFDVMPYCIAMGTPLGAFLGRVAAFDAHLSLDLDHFYNTALGCYAPEENLELSGALSEGDIA